MKKSTSLLAGVAAAFALLSSGSIYAQNFVLSSLWSQYTKAEEKDLPKDQLKILGQIKKEAGEKHLPWDFYLAVSKYEDVCVRINWKEREKRREEAVKEIAAFDEPVVSFYATHDESVRRSIFEKDRARLTKAHNPAFYKIDWRITSPIYGKVLLENLENDYEYVAMSLYLQGSIDSAAVSKVFGVRYPMQALTEFKSITGIYGEQERLRALEEFRRKYADKAVSLLARQELLSQRLGALQEADGRSEDYLALKAECERFEKDRKTFAKSEKTMAECCTRVTDILETLDSKSISFNIKDGVISVAVRNLDKATVKITKDKKTVHSATLQNPTRSFFRTDTLQLNLPDLDDGEYSVECSNGKTKSEGTWEKYTLSAAFKQDGKGTWAWATDYITGEPVGEYRSGFRKFDAKDKCVSIKSGGRTRLSREFWNSRVSFTPEKTVPQLRGILLTDRSAFTPEETVHFKAIIYRESDNLSVVEGRSITAILRDPQGDEISCKTLTMGEFGSAEGSFLLPRRERNGYYHLEIKDGDQYLCSKSIRVDDFVLPTFTVIFDRNDEPLYNGDIARVSGTVKAYSGHSLTGADISCKIGRWNSTVAEFKVIPDPQGRFEFSFPTDSTSWYNYYNIELTVTDGTGETLQFSHSVHTSRRPEPSDNKPKTYFFEDQSDETCAAIKMVAGSRKVWALVEVYGPYATLLESHIETIEPEGDAPASKVFRRELRAEDPDEISLSVTYFHDRQSEHYQTSCRRRDTSLDLPLSFTRFLDTTAPGSEYKFSISTAPGVECAATIFDKSSETIQPNQWNHVRVVKFLNSAPYYQWRSGVNGGGEVIIVGYGRGNKMMKSAAAVSLAAVEDPAEEEVAAVRMTDADSGDAPADIPIREDFSTTIAWEPCLRSDKDGNISFTFRNADKLSTFFVQIFAHDKKMRNETLRKEMLVTLPVKIAIVEPQFLYDNDTYRARITLSSAVARPISGTLTVNGKAEHLSVPAMGQIAAEVPVTLEAGAVELTLTAVFRPDEGSEGADGIRVRVPVRRPEQTLTEAHSGVLLAGDNRDALISRLRGEFTLLPGESAELREISILQMVREAVPQEFELGSDNSISLMKTLYASALAARLGSPGLSEQQLAELTDKLLACHKADGGFAWFAEMTSSPIVTAQILDYFSGLRQRGLPIPDALSAAVPAAVQYLDRSFFGETDRPWWCGRIALDQYLYVRSMFAGEPFGQKVDRETASSVRSLLVPSGDLGLQGAVFTKARRLLTLKALASSEEGLALARKLGIKLFAATRIRKTIERDTKSLTQYAVKHPHGGIYYPNAVMPWRGLIESELYAHSLLCQLMAEQGEKSIAEGIRLWLMLQKETQEWRSCPATVNALACVLDGSAETLDTRVVALSGTATLPFEDVVATGNGMKIECEYYVETSGSGARDSASESGRVLLREGDVLKVGSQVTAVYRIWNEENRSFVRIQAPRPACLRPVRQLSGYWRGAYRSVSAEASNFWFETYPEENTTLEESFYVTQSGVFHSAAPVIESLYAPHYRAGGTPAPAFRCE